MKDRETLLSLIKGKKVHISMDWDADGVAAGALICHLLSAYSTITYSASRYATAFPKSDYYIFIDRKPRENIPPKKVILIDHHFYKLEKKPIFILQEKAQSSTIIVYNKLVKDTKDPFVIFLILLGYFGDYGKREKIPNSLLTHAKKLLPELMILEKEKYGTRYKIEKYVSTLNIGKRTRWSGQLPFELLRAITEYKELTQKKHPIAKELDALRNTLKEIPNIKVHLEDKKNVLFGEIKHEANIQGWLCRKYLKTKPVLIINTHKKLIHGSLRVPDNIEFNAEEYIKKIAQKIPSTESGGHKKAAGFRTSYKNIDKLKEIISYL